ncbi:MAG: sensor histidine kinase [Proteobacteria bacterium]|nr:sensor histidine kinase [Pseudomonadota bacterium]
MTSLKWKLLAWLLPASLLLLLAGAATAYSIALHTASHAYDRVLLDTAADISDQVQSDGGVLRLDLSPAMQKILLNDQYDHFYYRVSAPDGRFIGGYEELPLGAEMPSMEGVFYETSYRGENLRAVGLVTHRVGAELRIVVAETLVKRDSLIREIWLGILVPELSILLLTWVLLLFAVRHGLAPLAILTRELSFRSPLDLSKVEETHAPDEVQPLVREINQLLERLDASQQSQRAFISNAAHQIRTPIAALQAHVELALRQTDGEKLTENLKLILAAVKRTAHVSNQILSLARSEQTNASMEEFRKLDLHVIAEEVGEIWIASAIEKEIDLGFELEHAEIIGSPMLLHELLSNLVHNAILYTPSGGRITVRVRREAIRVVLEVEDNGIGISAEVQHRIFERFFRPETSLEGGCGLGLSIVKEIANLHKATVKVLTPAFGSGSIFTVEFAGLL